MSTLRDKTAVVPGGAPGIGLAIAKRFAADGAYVFITGRRQSALDAAVAEIGENVEAVRADSAKLADLDMLYNTVRERRGNAGGQLRRRRPCGTRRHHRGAGGRHV